MNILHIINDSKFYEPCRQTFSIGGINNLYLESGQITKEFLDANSIQIIFIHYLKNKEVNFFSENKIDIPVIWMFWGADGFSLPLFYNYFIGRKTRAKIRQLYLQTRPLLLFKDLVKESIKTILNKSASTKRKIELISKFSFVVPVIPQDFDILKKRYPSITSTPFHFNYITPLFFEDYRSMTFVSGKNILLGNSSSSTNNHIEALDILRQSDLGSRKIILPLNYGDPFYREVVLRYVKRMKIVECEPLIDFLQFTEYKNIISTCEIMIMNHYRQQGLGNIIMGLLTGVTIYLSERSALFSYLLENGFIVHTIESIQQQGITVLNEDSKYINKQNCISIFGPETQHQRVSNLIKLIANL